MERPLSVALPRTSVRAWFPFRGGASLTTSLVATRRIAGVLLFVVMPLALVGLTFYVQWRIGALAFDFKGTVWEPGHAVLDGRSPFPAPVREAVDVANPALYPPAVALVALPFLGLPFAVAAGVWTGVLLGAVACALWLLGVRDWRCYALALSSWPVVLGASFGNVTLLLVLAAAVAWVYRDRPLVAGAAVGLAVAVKLFLWPLAVWLLLTRRTRAATASAGVGAVATIVSFAAIGFAGLREYPDILRLADSVFAAHSNSLFAGALGLGLDERAAHLIAFAAGGALLVGAAVFARRADGDRRSFAVALAAALAFTPIVWAHYFALLLVPLAAARPHFAKLWLVAPATWAVFLFVPLPRGTSAGKPEDVPAQIWEPLHAATTALWQTLAYTALATAVVAVAVRRRRSEGGACTG